MDRNFLYVPMGSCLVSESPNMLLCKGLGSCIALCVYDVSKRVGLLAHILLPKGDDVSKPFYFANLAVPAVLFELAKRGCNKNLIWAKIVGGANVFLKEENNLNIGTRNIDSIIEHLKKYKIKILNTDTGGNKGRNVYFDLRDGSVRVFTYEKGEYVI